MTYKNIDSDISVVPFVVYSLVCAIAHVDSFWNQMYLFISIIKEMIQITQHLLIELFPYAINFLLISVLEV